MAKETTFEHPPRGHAAMLGYDSVDDDFPTVLVDSEGHPQVDIVDSGGADLKDILDKLADILTELNAKLETADLDLDGSGRLSTNLHQYTGSAWVKSNLLWGYNAIWGEQQAHTKSGAGNYNLDSAAVPSGYVYVVKAVASNNTDKTVNHQHALVVNNYAVPILAPTSTTANTWRVTFPVDIVLAEDDFVRVTFASCDDGDDLYLRICGYKMKVDM